MMPMQFRNTISAIITIIISEGHAAHQYSAMLKIQFAFFFFLLLVIVLFCFVLFFCVFKWGKNLKINVDASSHLHVIVDMCTLHFIIAKRNVLSLFRPLTILWPFDVSLAACTLFLCFLRLWISQIWYHYNNITEMNPIV